MEIAILAVGVVCMVLLIVLLIRKGTSGGSEGSSEALKALQQQVENLSRENRESQAQLRQEVNASLNSMMSTLSNQLQSSQNHWAGEQSRQLTALFAGQKEQLQTIGTAQKEQLEATQQGVSRSLEEMGNSLTKHLQQLEQRFATLEANIETKLQGIRTSMESQLNGIRDDNTKQLDSVRKTVDEKLQSNTAALTASVTGSMQQLEQRFATLETNMETKLQGIRETVSQQLQSIRDDNTKQLEQIRGTVDEKLQKTLETKMNESFKLVSERLEAVYKGLGEMQSVAQGVGDLKKVLSNVKTRGILGEIQLGAILREILTADQYDENVATIPRSKNRVEFAVKLPGTEEGKTVYLPIDSKFNGDRFAHLQDAYETGNMELISAAKKELADAIKKCAKDISDKYIAPPHTTQFAIMFLPFEGLYAEVVNTPGLVEYLQNTYHVNVAGPSTMAAMLNSLRMGFQTLAIQKRSGEVWTVLGAVKTEFGKFEKVLAKTQERLRQAEGELEDLVGVRTRQMNSKLNRVDSLDSDTAVKLLSSDE